MKAAYIITSMILVWLLMIILAPQNTHAAWSNDPAVNTPIAVTEGYDWHPRILGDGSGGAIITWGRDGNIYAQRVNSNGDVLWTVNGVTVYVGAANLPQIASDGAGGAIITWLDGESIYAQRIDSNGNLVWPDVVTISNADLPLAIIYSPALTSDGAGGAIISWNDYRTGNTRLYAQRIDASGSVQWAQNGVAVSNLIPACTGSPIVVSDGDHGAIITWSDCHNGNSNSDIYAQKIDANGAVKWGNDGAAVCTAAYNQSLNDAISDGSGGAFITWYDRRSGYRVYVQKMDTDGNARWAPNGVAMGAGVDTTSSLASDGSGGALITWLHSTSSVPIVYAQRLDNSGNPQWTASGIVISDYSFNMGGGLNITSDGSGGAIIGWLDGHNGNGQGFLYGQRVDNKGSLLWGPGGVAVSTPSRYSVLDIRLVSDGSGGAIFTWYDQRNFNITSADIYAQRVLADGKLVPFSPTVATTALSAISASSATGGGNVTSDGGNPVTSRGVCWGTAANPTIADSCSSDGSGTGTFTSFITGLSAVTAYHVRAYATNASTTAYGDDRSFTTYAPLSVMLQGTGTGTVHSTDPDINCSGGTCTQSYPFGVDITLTAAPITHSQFTGWSGYCTNTIGTCTVTMDGIQAVLATFDIDPAYAVWIDPGTNYFSTIGAAYQAAGSSALIKACSLEFTENLVFELGKSIILSGGYNSSYSNVSGRTTVKGPFIVRNGNVRVKNLAIH